MPQPKEKYTVPLRSPNGDGALWGQIVEIKAALIPLRRGKASQYDALYESLMLRLEQTDDQHGLVMAFDTYAHLKGAVAALRKRFARHGSGFVNLTMRKDPPVLYVWRGPNWSK